MKKKRKTFQNLKILQPFGSSEQSTEIFDLELRKISWKFFFPRKLSNIVGDKLNEI